MATALALGFGLGAVIWAGAAMAGLALLFEIVPQLFTALKVVGSIVLIYIAVMMWRHAATPLPQADLNAAPRSVASAIRFGLLTFVANPKPAVFFGAIFVGLIPSEASLATRAALLLAIFLNETLWYVVVARVFSLPRARAAYIGLKSSVDRTFGALIAAFGLKIALS